MYFSQVYTGCQRQERIDYIYCPPAGYSFRTFILLVLITLVPQLVGHTCINASVRIMPATIVSIAILAEPAGASLLGWIILGEKPQVVDITGGIIIISGIIMVLGRRYTTSN